MSKHSRIYSTARWRKLRDAKLKTDPLCWYCNQRGVITAADTVDHIIPHRGDYDSMWAWDNLRSACKACHDSAGHLKDVYGFVPGVGVDGVPLSGDHPWIKK